jgi:hypothetical protein
MGWAAAGRYLPVPSRYGDHPVGHPEFKVLAVLVAGPTTNGRRHHQRDIIFFLTVTVM